jgi:TolB-like protein/DNA-binding winged helix-turn-helix (wHTH) protein/tetratricopeptide (TPR) repeat protein
MGNVGRKIYFFEDYTLDLTRGCLRNANGELELRAKSFEVLAYLVTNSGRLVSKDELVKATWPNVVVSDDSLVQCISEARQALNDADRRIIRTVLRRGYLFAAPVTQGGGAVPGPAPSDQQGDSTNIDSAGATAPLVAGVELPPNRSRRGLARHRAAFGLGAVVAICLAVAGLWTWPGRDGSVLSILAPAASAPRTAPPVRVPPLSLVVLPFTNLSGDPDQEYFADGITDDLTTDISRIAGSLVIARNTAFTYKGKSVDAKQIGHDLGVRYVVEGSVRRAGDRIVVNVQLVDAESGTHVWADRFETDRRNLTEAQSEITGRLARTLNVELARDSGRRIELARMANPDARDFVMRAWSRYYRPFSPAGVQEALQDFERALEIDPLSVDARIGIATLLLGRVSVGWSSSDQQDLARAEQLLAEALEADLNRSTAHVAMGVLRRNQLRFSESKMEFETAIALDRNNARAIFQLGTIMVLLGQPEAGIPLIEKAIRLNPHDPTLASHYAMLGLCHLFLDHLDQAIELFRKARAGNPRSYYIHLYLAGALGLKGELDEAKEALAESLRLNPEINSFAAQRARAPWITHPAHWELREKTLNLGLRRIGHPEE